MDNKEKKVLEEAGLLYPAPNCIEYCQIVKATADEVAQRIFEAMSDYVSVMRCKNCRHFEDEDEDGNCWCLIHNDFTKRDAFCSWGKRKDEVEN